MIQAEENELRRQGSLEGSQTEWGRSPSMYPSRSSTSQEYRQGSPTCLQIRESGDCSLAEDR